MTISCFTVSDEQLRQIVRRLKEAGLFSQYEEQAHGESILVSVRTRTFDEKEKVTAIFSEVGITEFWYRDENVA